MQDLKGRTAVVTGAASGIGRALARRAAAAGMNVAMADMNPAALTALETELKASGVNCLAMVVDVSNADQMKSFADQCFAQFSEVALLFNNAGILRFGKCWEPEVSDWQMMLNVNVMGVVNGIHAFVPKIIEAGNEAHIVNTGSVGSLISAPWMGQYTATKMAIRGISECLLFDLQESEASIGVSLLCPGPVISSISDGAFGAASGEKVLESDQHPMAGQPDFIAPEAVADKVFDAIAEQRFWVFTHAFNDTHQQVLDAQLAGNNPEFKQVVFED